MPTLKLDWVMASRQRYYAYVGPLSIEVRNVGFARKRYWIVGDVFGKGASAIHGLDGKFQFLPDAQLAAEQVSLEMLVRAREDAKARGLRRSPSKGK